MLVRKDNAVDGQTSTPGGTKPDCSAADREHANDNDPTKQPTSAMEGPEAVLDDSQTDYGGMIYRRCKSGAPGDGKSTTWPAEAAKCDGVVKACASTCDPSTCQVWKDCDPNEDDSTKAKFCTPGESDFYHPASFYVLNRTLRNLPCPGHRIPVFSNNMAFRNQDLE